ncbi:hypothetical protein JTB14_034344 [Gonioctena quinquepunctata]|nr:hypothetical protein JTB14_034344 [Gonioctena quinquepunctata]
MVPISKPWKWTSSMEGDQMPKPWMCTAYVPNRDGEKIGFKRILTGLRLGNKGIKTLLWTPLRCHPVEKRALWNSSGTPRRRQYPN